ncbi:MAG TPA: hypothetical protein VGD67_21075 [Pseudonocardiaceae bacterium]
MVVRPGGLDLDREPDLVPADLVRTFSVFGSVGTIAGYENVASLVADNFTGVVTHVHQTGRPVPPGVNVLLFPYDFRRSVRDAAHQLADAVRGALGEDPVGRPVVVLAHSMGGLVARYWIGPLGGWSVCAALLTLGTPHRGAPKAVDWLLNGPGIGPLRHPGVRRVLRGWPSVYELLPQYPAVWDSVAGHEVELTTLPTPSPYAETFARMAADGRAVHEDIATAWSELPADAVPDVVPYFGRGHATPNLLTLQENGRLTITKDDPPWRGNVGWRGDGTVPVLSAVPRELGEHRGAWRGVAERHGPIATTPSFVDQLLSWSGEPVPTRGEAPDRPWLGLDLEDVVPAGAEFDIGVRVQPDELTADAVRLAVTPVPPTGPPAFVGPLTAVGPDWSISVPPLAPGRYRVDLEARLTANVESVFGVTDLVVLDPAEEAEAAEASA